MSSPNTQGKSDDLQFDRAQTSSGQPTGAGTSVSCVVCKRAIETEYYTANGKPVCRDCRQRVETESATPRGAGTLLRALTYGIGAAIAGAAIYYAVMAIADLEIGIVAILIGYMVGYAVRKGAAGRGGRRFQIIAAVLTYWAVGLAYSPFAFKGMIEGKGPKTTASSVSDSAVSAGRIADSARANALGDSVHATNVDTTAKPVTRKSAEPVSTKAFIVALGALLFLVFALPVVAIFGSMPSGLISAFIIFIGLRQAWKMTAGTKVEFSGPHKVGGGPAKATS
jgi:hypothetical protein